VLKAISIQNIVLIDDLQIDFETGLCVLTGETGAGKSILLDALGLALGGRAEARLFRQGATKAQVIATFSLPENHPVLEELDVHEIEQVGGELIFRRHLDVDGKSKCFLNDQIISQTLMRRLGQSLVEIHGQFEGLLDPKSHIEAVDTYGALEKVRVQDAYQAYHQAKKDLQLFQTNLAKSLERKTFLNFAIEEIEKVAPLPGEEESLEVERAFVSHHAKIAEAITIVEKSCDSALSDLVVSHKALNRICDLLPEKLTPLIQASDRALVEIQEVVEGMRDLKSDVEGTPRNLEVIENRLHSLRQLLRKYQCADILEYLKSSGQELSLLDHGEDHIHALKEQLDVLKGAYQEVAKTLSEERKKAAHALEVAIRKELPPLKLEHARFRVNIAPLEETAWGPNGFDRVEFYIQTNPGSPEGPLASIASGGELSRLMLALKAVLVSSASVPTLIFDEIESGTGGAVASAMGDRLKVLSQTMQVLAITHSPQIASSGDQHFVVFKVMAEKETTTHVRALDRAEKYEEVARMLAGEEITDEARAAAKSLIGKAR